MNRPAKHAIIHRNSPAAWSMPQIAAQVEEWLADFLLPAVAAAAMLLFFTIIYGMVDDLLVAGVITVVVPMMFLPLVRHEGAG